MASDFVVPKDGGPPLGPRVSPGAKSAELRDPHDDAAPKLMAAPPTGATANAGAERFLAALIGVPSSAARLVRGRSARDKTVFVVGVGVERAREALPFRRR